MNNSTTPYNTTSSTTLAKEVDSQQNIVYITYGQSSGNASMAIVLLMVGFMLIGGLWGSIYMNAKTAYSVPMSRGDRYDTGRNNLRLEEGPVNFGSNNYGIAY